MIDLSNLGNESRLNTSSSKTGARRSVRVTNQFGNVQQYCEDESEVYTDLINLHLQKDEELKQYDIMPINRQSMDSLLSACQNGVLLCKLINCAVPNTIIQKAINTRKHMNIHQIHENLRLAISSAKAIGCIIYLSHDMIYEKQFAPVFGMIWQILRIMQIYSMNLKNNPGIMKLKKESETLEEFLALKTEDFLLRWVNYHLEKAGLSDRIKNLNKDLADMNIYIKLLDQLTKGSKLMDKEKMLGIENLLEKAQEVLNVSGKVGVPKIIRNNQLVANNQNINLIYLTQLFTARNGLEDEILTEIELQEFKEEIKEDDQSGSKEERQYRLWVNQLNIDGVRVMNLFSDLKQDVVLLRILDKVQPGSIDWKQVEHNPNNHFKKLTNANYAIKVSKEVFKFSLVGISGADLVQGNKLMTLALVWQLVYKHTMATIGAVNEKHLLQWANSKVSLQIKSLADKSMSDCKFLFALIGAISKDCYDPALVLEGDTEDEIKENCNYFLSCARKMGAVIFLVWEDIVKVNMKMMIVLFAELNKIDKHGKSASTYELIGKKMDF